MAEGVKQAMGEATTTSYVHHSSVGRELREEVEETFSYRNESQCVVCTSTMELGRRDWHGKGCFCRPTLSRHEYDSNPGPLLPVYPLALSQS